MGPHRRTAALGVAIATIAAALISTPAEGTAKLEALIGTL